MSASVGPVDNKTAVKNECGTDFATGMPVDTLRCPSPSVFRSSSTVKHPLQAAPETYTFPVKSVKRPLYRVDSNLLANAANYVTRAFDSRSLAQLLSELTRRARD